MKKDFVSLAEARPDLGFKAGILGYSISEDSRFKS